MEPFTPAARDSARRRLRRLTASITTASIGSVAVLATAAALTYDGVRAKAVTASSTAAASSSTAAKPSPAAATAAPAAATAGSPVAVSGGSR